MDHTLLIGIFYRSLDERIRASDETVQPFLMFELLFFALFGFQKAEDLMVSSFIQGWTLFAFKLVFATYLLLTVVVLINLLIAMMSDTYQRIQQQSDIEWKYGLAKLIRNMQSTQVLKRFLSVYFYLNYRYFLGCTIASKFAYNMDCGLAFLVYTGETRTEKCPKTVQASHEGRHHGESPRNEVCHRHQ